MARRHCRWRTLFTAAALAAGAMIGGGSAPQMAGSAHAAGAAACSEASFALLVPKRTRLIINYRRSVIV